jgi:regulatory protein
VPSDRQPRSLEARALGFLARREYSRVELRARLAAHAPDADTLEAVLDRLASKKLLSDQRFVESVVRRRAERFGTARIRHELRSHDLSAEQLEPALQALKASEFDRALEVWRKRFGEPPDSRESRARQMRFLAGRGFAPEVIRRVVGGQHHEADDMSNA